MYWLTIKLYMCPLIKKKKLSFLGGSVDFFFFHSKNTILAPMSTKYIIVDHGLLLTLHKFLNSKNTYLPP